MVARLTNELIDKIRVLPISELINKQYPDIKLQTLNSVHVGLCPFHHESKPSFTIFNNNGVESFYCYGCHAGNYKETRISSDIIGFYMAIENIDFKTACERLCNIFGIQFGMALIDPEADRLRQAAYQKNIEYFNALSKDANALAYLYNRGLNDESVKRWQLGLVPADDNMAVHRNRLAIPLIDTSGASNNICGFAYRSLNNDNLKYRNDSGSRIFNKKQLLYGLPQAQETIRRMNAVILVEGYFDVMLMHQCNVTNTVGLMGAGLTIEQANALKKLASRVFLLMDNDEAGVNALYRIIPTLYQECFEVYVCSAPSGMDPADMCNHLGRDNDAVARYLTAHTVPAYQFMLQRSLIIYQNRIHLAKTELLQQSLPLMDYLRYIDRMLYTQYLSNHTGIDPYLLDTQYRR